MFDSLKRGFPLCGASLFLVRAPQWLLLVGLVLCSSCLFSAPKPKPEQTEALVNRLAPTVRSGDIVVRCGVGLVSALIRAKVGDSISASHCGIVVQDQGQWRVVHSLSRSVSSCDGMQCCSLAEFIEDSEFESLRVVRFKLGDGEVIAARALDYLAQKIPFNEAIDLGDTTRFFCSQLPIHIIYSQYGVDLVPELERQGRNIPRFSLFLDPRYFEIVY